MIRDIDKWDIAGGVKIVGIGMFEVVDIDCISVVSDDWNSFAADVIRSLARYLTAFFTGVLQTPRAAAPAPRKYYSNSFTEFYP